MSDENEDLAAAKKLEEIKLHQDISDMTPQREAEINAIGRKLAAQGLSQSGSRFMAEVEIMFDSIQGVVDKAVARRRDLGAQVPGLLTTATLATLENTLAQLVSGTVTGVSSRLRMNPRNAAGGAVMRRVEQRSYAMKARLKSALAALPLEVKFGMPDKKEVPAPAINISHSTVGNINLGNVIGDLNSSIKQLTAEGYRELGDALQNLGEAILASKEIGNSEKKDLLEHAAFVSGEMALPSEQRKMGPVKTSIEALKSGVQVATQLVGLWQAVEKALQMMGVLHPSS